MAGGTQHIVVVDEHDNFIGEEEKEKCHDGGGILHRGFLAMIFNHAGELLLARRSAGKRLWPGFWDGTVASHVIKGEDYILASKRRLGEEIGLVTNDIEYLFKFHYKVGYMDIGTENEICAVTVVKSVETDMISPNREEISDIRFTRLSELEEELGKTGNGYTPWFILAMEHMGRMRQ